MYPELSAEFGALHVESFLAALAADTLAEARRFMQPDGIHPNAEGVALIVEALGPVVERLIEAAAGS